MRKAGEEVHHPFFGDEDVAGNMKFQLSKQSYFSSLFASLYLYKRRQEEKNGIDHINDDIIYRFHFPLYILIVKIVFEMPYGGGM